uniref:P/Homo B domain-containing protein n=2 Tax=Mesocestoides corti TaxID=53468 RepID=A0A5K3FT81_MESCO
MGMRAVFGSVLVLFIFVGGISSRIRTNQWLVRLHTDGVENRDVMRSRAKQIAEETGFKPWLVDHDHYFNPNEFLFLQPALSKPSKSLHEILVRHPDVESAEQLRGYKRTKRGFRPIEKTNSRKGASGRLLTPTESEIIRSLSSDPLFRREWYIHNTGQAGGTPGLDLNVLSAWAQNITGRGVTTAIMDDGIDYLHPDIAPNYAAEASYDFSGNDAFPYPRYTDDWFNSHGTRCAGEVAAVAGNGVCGVGVAPNSRVAGLRMLDQPYMTDLIEAAAMSQARDIIDIYSASWGPTDDGKTVDGPRNQTMQAIVDGVNKGRRGKGSLYVWASGDGGPEDDCNCDGYAASMWTISINSATNDGQTASYDESCASTLASTFSNGKSMLSLDTGVGTIDLYGNCTLHHSGTSAAAPEAAGVLALALEANPELTWRDMQHLIVLTSKRNHLYDREGTHNWTINGAGLEFNHLFGYGVLDAGDMVRIAKLWKTV